MTPNRRRPARSATLLRDPVPAGRRSRSTPGRAAGAVLAALLLTALLVAPAGADATATEANWMVSANRAARGAYSPAVSRAPTAQAATPGSGCFADPASDEALFTDPPGAATDPRVDIIEHCVDYGPTLNLTGTVVQPTDPDSDTNWTGATFFGWFIDVDADAVGDFLAALHLDDSSTLIGEVIDVRVPGSEPVACVGAATFTGVYAISNIPASCIADATDIAVSPIFYYDTVPSEGAGGGVVFDLAPNDQTTVVFDGPLAGGEPRPSRRLAGDDRIGTAIAISRAEFPGTASTVFLARSDLFADAVTGGVLTAGPILLVPSCGAVPAAVSAEIIRLDPDEVIALGGTSAVCDPLLDAAGAGRSTDRLGGLTRVETAVEISKFQFPGGSDDVHIARSDVFADAVVGGVLTGGPILLTPSCGGVPSVVRNEVVRLGPDRVVGLGGPVAVCDANLTEAAGGIATTRLAGATRIETAVEISRFEFPAGADELYLARDGRPTAPGGPDDLFADAAVGGVLTGGPILLVPSCGALPTVVGDEISRVGPDRVTGLGGVAAICDALFQQATEF